MKHSSDYESMMDMAEEIVTQCTLVVHRKLTIDYQGMDICLERPWRRETMHNLVKEATGLDFIELSNDLKVAKEVAVRTLVEVAVVAHGLPGMDTASIGGVNNRGGRKPLKVMSSNAVVVREDSVLREVLQEGLVDGLSCEINEPVSCKSLAMITPEEQSRKSERQELKRIEISEWVLRNIGGISKFLT
ncbi:hypothetical protein F0562_001290 [Nyssa sinensis]|uniref:Uncharacterized protein n=1 Tax=Nyssa sinensis TaxID=561372 RepID=A0A5J5C6U0_9ASTE|nr:hypothetical protein F0562_001290 [Nyssa sinensis]